MEKIEFNNLSFAFTAKQPLLTNINASFEMGKIHLLTGISGSGKSTLLKLIAGLLPKYGGDITAGNYHVPTTRISMLFQDPLMQFALDTPRHELEFTLENCQVPPEQMAARIASALDFAQVKPLADHLITTLSGGQQQRVALAAVVAMEPQILLLDEPFANIDEQTRTFILKQLSKLNQEKHVTIIITDHECYGYQALHPHVWLLADKQLTVLPLHEGQRLLASADLERAQPIKASVPANSAPEIIRLEQLAIKRGNLTLLNEATQELIKNKTTLITGQNGVGKSTLLKAIARLTSYEGKIAYKQHDIQKISPGKYFQKVGLIFQHANDQFLNVTVREELDLSIKNGQNPYFTNQHLQQSLHKLGLAGHEEQVVYSLSGGQKKKLQLLLMLMMGQEVLLLDEPFTGLDASSLVVVRELIHASRQVKPMTLLIVSHQFNGLDGLIDYHLVLHHQQLSYQRS